MLDSHVGSDRAYDAAVSDVYFAGPRRDPQQPAPSEFQALLENVVVSTLAIKRAYTYQVLEW